MKAELKWLHEEGTLEPVEVSDSAAPIVPELKMTTREDIRGV